MAAQRATARYQIDRSGFQAYMMSDEIHDLAMAVAREIIPIAISLSPASAPEDKGQSDGTRYTDHFDVKAAVISVGKPQPTPRRAAKATNDSVYSVQVEFGIGSWQRDQGGSHGRPSRPLGRAALVVGALYGDYAGGPPG